MSWELCEFYGEKPCLEFHSEVYYLYGKIGYTNYGYLPANNLPAIDLPRLISLLFYYSNLIARGGKDMNFGASRLCISRIVLIYSFPFCNRLIFPVQFNFVQKILFHHNRVSSNIFRDTRFHIFTS